MSKPLTAALISLGSVSSQWTFAEMQKCFSAVDMIDLRQLEVNLGDQPGVFHNGVPLKEYDCVFAKGSFRFANLLKSVSMMLYDHCYMPTTPSAFTTVHNKLLTHLELQKHNVPMPRTYVSASTDAAKAVLKKVNYPIVMKFPEGTQGKGVMFADSFASASSLLDALGLLNQPFIIQEYIDTGGVDYRALVVGDQVVASMQRKAAPQEMRSNIHAGGQGRSVALDRSYQKIAVDVAKALGTEVCGVDILEGSKGPLVIEANLSPGLQGITAATGVNVAAHIAKLLHQKTTIRVEGKSRQASSQIMKSLDAHPEGSLITTLKIRGESISLPPLVTRITGFNERDNYKIKAEKGKLNIEKFA